MLLDASEFTASDYSGHAVCGITTRVEKVEAQKITFYFGDTPLGEVKFLKAGTKEDKIERCKKALMKKVLQEDKSSLIGQMLYSPFCNFRIL